MAAPLLSVVRGPAADYRAIPSSRADWDLGFDVVFDDVVVQWGGDTARGHAEAGRISLTLLSRSPTPPIKWGEEITVWLFPQLSRPFLIGHGWVSEIVTSSTNTPTARGSLACWEHSVELIDVIGRAAATRVGASPWPQQVRDARAAAINAAAGWNVIDRQSISDATPYPLATRDVDNVPALELAQRTLMQAGFVAEGERGLVANLPSGTQIDWPFTMRGLSTPYPAKVSATSGAPVRIAANRLTQSARHIDRRSLISAITWQAKAYIQKDNGLELQDWSRTIYASPRRTDDAPRLTFNDDAVVPTELESLGQIGGALSPLFVSMLRESQAPLTRLDDVELANPTADELYALARIPARATALIAITGADPTIPELQRVTGGTFHARGNDWPQLELKLEPAQLSGTRPLRLNDVPEVAGGAGRIPVRIRDMGQLRPSDGAAVAMRL